MYSTLVCVNHLFGGGGTEWLNTSLFCCKRDRVTQGHERCSGLVITTGADRRRQFILESSSSGSRGLRDCRWWDTGGCRPPFEPLLVLIAVLKNFYAKNSDRKWSFAPEQINLTWFVRPLESQILDNSGVNILLSLCCSISAASTRFMSRSVYECQNTLITLCLVNNSTFSALFSVHSTKCGFSPILPPSLNTFREQGVLILAGTEG